MSYTEELAHTNLGMLVSKGLSCVGHKQPRNTNLLVQNFNLRLYAFVGNKPTQSSITMDRRTSLVLLLTLCVVCLLGSTYGKNIYRGIATDEWLFGCADLQAKLFYLLM
jgi:surface polysaccharide O-acyltransferase-like enzyme